VIVKEEVLADGRKGLGEEEVILGIGYIRVIGSEVVNLGGAKQVSCKLGERCLKRLCGASSSLSLILMLLVDIL